MVAILALLALLFALPAQAQYVQGDVINASPDTSGAYGWTPQKSYSYTFPKPLVAPCTLIVTVRQPGLLVTDSQGNAFSLLTNANQYGQAFSSPTCASGADTITVTCPSGTCWAQVTFSHYTGLWTLAQMAPDGESVGSVASTLPVTPLVNGSLIVSFGSNHTTNTPQVTPGAGFTLRASGNEFIEDFIQQTAAPVVGSATYSASVSWCQMTLVFKPVASFVPQQQKINIFGGLRYCTLCDKADDTVTGINLLAGLQVWLNQMDAAGTAIGSVTFTMDANGNISGSDNVIINATNPLLFTVSVRMPNGTVLSGLFQGIAIDPIHLQGEGSIHILIRLDPVTPLKIRGVDWWTGA